MSGFTLDDLRSLLRDCAGEDEGVDLSGDIADTPLHDLGYESLAVVELGVRLERFHGLPPDGATLQAVMTPRQIVALVGAGPADVAVSP